MAAMAQTPFVGRERELAELRAGMEFALAGSGRLLLLAGEPGIGKTRTMEVLTGDPLAEGAIVLQGRCSELAGAPAYWPWIQIIRAYIQTTDPEQMRGEMGAGAAQIARIVPEVSQLVGELPDPPDLSPEESRFRLFDAITTFLSNVARAQPLILTLDDLHRADEPSLLLLRFLAGEIQATPLLILGNYRNTGTDVSGKLEEALAELSRTRGNRSIVLRRLQDESAASYIQHALGSSSPELIRRIQTETEGHPFYLAEVVRLLTLQGDRSMDPVVSDQALPVPESVAEVIARRLDQLQEPCSELLTTSAVIGRDFDLRLLADVSGNTSEAILELLDDAIRLGIIQVPEPPGPYRFSHILIQQVIYNRMPVSRRLQLHRDAGLAIERLAQSERYLDELARHFSLAAPLGVGEQAIRYTRQAGDQAMEQLAWEVAIVHYRLALDLLDQLLEDQPELRCDLLINLGIAAWDGGDREAAQHACYEAAGIARVLADSHRFAQAAYVFTGGDHISLGIPRPEAVELLSEALGLLPEKDSALRIGLLRWLAGNLAEMQQEFDRQLELTLEAVISARRLGNDRALGQALITHARVIAGPDNIEELREIALEVLDLGQRSGDVHTTLFGYAGLEPVALLSGDPDLLDHCTESKIRIRRQLKMAAHRLADSLSKLTVAVATGDFDDAETCERRFRQHSRDIYTPEFQDAVVGMALFPMRREQLRLQEMETIIRNGIAHDPNYLMLWKPLLTMRLVETGQPDAAWVQYNEIVIEEWGRPRNLEWFTMTVLLAELTVILGDSARQPEIYRILIPYGGLIADHHRADLRIGAVAHYLGLLAAAMGEVNQAVRHFQDAISMNSRMRYRPFAAWSRAQLGETLLRRDLPGDRDRAVGLLEQARATATEIGMLRLLNYIEPVIRQEDAEEQSPAATLGLTPRQVEVLELIVQGKTDREIASELYISHYTVMRHVSNILNTLGVDTRTAAAAVAVREDIV